MKNLNSFIFTKDSDTVEVFDDQLFNDTLVETLNGDDIIESDNFFDSVDVGIINNGTITTGKGDDSLLGDGSIGGISNDGLIRTGQGNDVIRGVAYVGIGIKNTGTINTGRGNDFIEGVSLAGGIENEGIIRTGQGDDFVSSLGFLLNEGIISLGHGDDSLNGGGEGDGIINNGLIRLGQGNDFLYGSGFSDGIVNRGIIRTGKGNDTLDGSGMSHGIINDDLIHTGKGEDFIVGDSLSAPGIKNNDLIYTGKGNDFIKGSSQENSGIINEGKIDTGKGNDFISGNGFTDLENSEFEGFDGGGLINLGAGNDLIEGFGNQVVNGGKGFDKAKFGFNSNEVDVSITSDNSLVIESLEREMTFTNIELFEFGDFAFSFDDGSFKKVGEVSTLDFDEGNLAAGTIVTDQFEGIDISTSSEFGVMIFDTGNPTGGDDDLFTFSQGNVLIISEDGDSADPDDNAAGGTIHIEFDELATVTSIGLLDIEETGSSINLFADDSSLIEVIEIEPRGDRSLQELNLNLQGVASIDINLAGSGALTELNFLNQIDDSGIIDTSNELT